MSDLTLDSITPAQQMASSCAGAFLVSMFMTPLDVVKIRLQAQDMVFSRKCFLYSNGLMDHLCPRVNGDPVPTAKHTWEEICNCKWYNRPKYFTGTLDAFVKIAKVEGVSSLWSGLSPTLVLALPTTVIYFTSYEQIKSRLYQSGKFSDLPFAESGTVPLTAGALARVWAVTVVSPLELIRTKMQSEKMRFGQMKEALKVIVKNEGILGLWKGYTPTLYRDVPFSAIYWAIYEACKKKMLMNSEPKFSITFTSGAIAGTVASAITLPMDVIKTRRQIEFGEAQIVSGKSGEKYKLKSTMSVVRDILTTQGPKGLFTGLTPRVLKVAPACAIMISSYEYCKNHYRHKNRELQSAVIE